MSELILKRRSVRKFNLDKKLSYETLEELCRNGEAAPSARRQASREYIIVDDSEIIGKLSQVSKGSMVLSDCNTLIAVVGTDNASLPTPDMQAQDLSAATENILLAATDMGIGSCWIGIYPKEDRVSRCNEILGITDKRFTFSLIALGIPEDEDCFRMSEKEPVIHHNRG